MTGALYLFIDYSVSFKLKTESLGLDQILCLRKWTMLLEKSIFAHGLSQKTWNNLHEQISLTACTFVCDMGGQRGVGNVMLNTFDEYVRMYIILCIFPLLKIHFLVPLEDTEC